eukprot:7675707-Alexandrium_andersonii.AAC.1
MEKSAIPFLATARFIRQWKPKFVCCENASSPSSGAGVLHSDSVAALPGPARPMSGFAACRCWYVGSDHSHYVPIATHPLRHPPNHVRVPFVRASRWARATAVAAA